MKRVLLFHVMVPDDLLVYLLDVDMEVFTKLLSLHGKYVNTVGISSEDSEWLCEFLEDKPHVYRDSVGEIPKLPHEGLDAIVVTGFIL